MDGSRYIRVDNEIENKTGLQLKHLQKRKLHMQGNVLKKFQNQCDQNETKRLIFDSFGKVCF